MGSPLPLPPLLFVLLLALLLPPPAAAAGGGPSAWGAFRGAAGSRRASPAEQEAAAAGVLRRLLHSDARSFSFQIDSKGSVCGESSCFRISNVVDNSGKGGAEILIQGTTGVELVSGLHWYLKYWCGAHISWDKTGGAQLASVPSPGSLPRVKGKGVKIERPVPWNYYQNVVTSSYRMNFYLMHIQKCLHHDITALKMISSGGVRSLEFWWGGPLSQNWLDQQLALQKKILSRMIELGMVPVLPSFSGNVPAVFSKLFPSANITQLGDWNTVDADPRWCCTYLLGPSDALFIEVGQAFIKQQIKVMAVTFSDTFNENTPPTNEPAYISSLGSAIYEAMSRGNKNAVWLMQGWLFYSDAAFWKEPQMKALLHSVPIGKMIVLDLFADVKPIWKMSSQFYGVPYIWCLLHNFGGNIEMYGILDSVASGPIDAHMSNNSTMIGVGMCLEGIEQNPVVYELTSEMAFRDKKVEVEDYNKDYIVEFPDISPSSFSSQLSKRRGMSIQSNHRRFFLSEVSGSLPHPHLWYSTKEAIKAFEQFLSAGSDFSRSLTYRYDLVDLTRQCLSKLANEVYLDAMHSYQKKDLNGNTRKFLEIIVDIDTLLAADDNFLLGSWLESAKSLAVTENERKQYEWNARTQVTMWYDNTETEQSKLHDYGNAKYNSFSALLILVFHVRPKLPANKFWSGLLKSYYLPRASKYFAYLTRSLQENRSFQLEEWRKDWISYSNQWQSGKELYAVKATGDALAISRSLYRKYFS
ncbi:alpha-N-acetylglucosaminidase isoform X1 [Panicum miliaceum]|uniref:Alpha-N-acetylglucosaminidase isoform X1 n=1 Tax=Panicum miliaceum TaxID=4540 RepID=A0A3L6TFY6_PANMI|nr:alpha-N-acetylglucosaminidase isoform X1 [Panicum miliaceum]